MMNKQIEEYDIVVVGAGMIGAAAALSFAREGWSVALIEYAVPEPFDGSSEPDVRVSALSCVSIAQLEQLGAWQAVTAMRVTPYRHLETWEEEHNRLCFSASELGLPTLGAMVENRLLQLGLWQQFANMPGLALYCPDGVEQLEYRSEGWKLTLASGRSLQAHLVVGADGAHSQIRKLAAIGQTGWQYRHDCLLITVKTELPQQDTTWQCFYPSGPRAFLPLHDEWACLVWYDSPPRIRQLLRLSNSALAEEIQYSFPPQLGNVTVIKRAAFPLVRRHAQHYVKEGLVLLGDAAHTINPLAGQGVNLGYRDLDALLDILIAARDRGEKWYASGVLQRYQRQRQLDNLLMQGGMDLFYKGFSNSLPPFKLARNTFLALVQRNTLLKKKVLQYAVGL